jgi:DNA-directed RNA polymerase subunit RPC12/RpoP
MADRSDGRGQEAEMIKHIFSKKELVLAVYEGVWSEARITGLCSDGYNIRWKGESVVRNVRADEVKATEEASPAMVGISCPLVEDNYCKSKTLYKRNANFIKHMNTSKEQYNNQGANWICKECSVMFPVEDQEEHQAKCGQKPKPGEVKVGG